MNNFQLMARFNGWVNEQLYETVATLSEADYRADRGLFFGSIHCTLNHLLAVDHLWTGRIEGVDRGVGALDQVLYDEFAALRRARRDEDGHLIALVEGLDDEALGRPVTYRRMIGEGEQTTRCDHILLTLFNHQTHHRGQLHAALTQAGVSLPPLDVIFYLEELGLS
jgi:uncharacterized damage-inducible protein DinB